MPSKLLHRFRPGRPAPDFRETGVSVAIPLFNHERYIGEALRSVLTQGPRVWEIIVVDDGSLDGGAAIVEQIAREDPRIRLVRQENRGAHVALATALGACSGEFLAILNSDDAWLPGRLQALTAALEADPTAGFAVSGLAFMDGAGQEKENAWQRDALRYHTEGAELGVALLNGNFVMTTSNLLVRRSCWERVGVFAALRYAHDLDWILRALALGERMLRLDAPLLRYRMHDANTISEDHGRVRTEWAVTAAAYLTTILDRPGASPVAWDHVAAALSVLRRHELDRSTALAMAYLRREGAPPLQRSKLLTDMSFLAKVAALC